MSKATSMRASETLNVALFDKLSSVLKSAASFIDTRLLLHDKGVLNPTETHH